MKTVLEFLWLHPTLRQTFRSRVERQNFGAPGDSVTMPRPEFDLFEESGLVG